MARILFQFNVAKMAKPYSDPVFNDFKAWLTALHALAEAQSGFVWRYRGEKDKDGYIKADPADDLMMGNLSAWRDYQSLALYTFTDGHLQIMRSKRKWFKPIPHPWTVLWWADETELTRPQETLLQIAREKLIHLTKHGNTREAFGFGHHNGNVDDIT